MNERIENSEIAIESTKKDIETQKLKNEEINKEIEAKNKMLQDFMDSRTKLIKDQVATRVDGMLKDAIAKKQECVTKIAETEKQLQASNEALLKYEAAVQKHSTKSKRLKLIYDEKKKHSDDLKSGTFITRNC
jgi:hypothetical protein